jgi:hypothetical protein
MGESILLFVMGMLCFALAAILPVLPIVLVIITIGGVVKAILKIFQK